MSQSEPQMARIGGFRRLVSFGRVGATHLRAIVLLIGLLAAAVAAASGQYLLSAEVVAELSRSQRLLFLDPLLSGIAPGVSLLIASAILLASLARFRRDRPLRHEGAGDDLSSRRPERVAWLVPLGFGAFFLGLGLAILLARNLLAGTYRPDFPLILLAALAALGLAFLCNDLRLGIAFLPSALGGRGSWRTELALETVYLLAIALLFVYANLRDLTGFFYSAIGDEYSLFYFAKNIALGASFNPFSQTGVYGYHPVADSAYQA